MKRNKTKLGNKQGVAKSINFCCLDNGTEGFSALKTQSHDVELLWLWGTVDHMANEENSMKLDWSH